MTDVDSRTNTILEKLGDFFLPTCITISYTQQICVRIVHVFLQFERCKKKLDKSFGHFYVCPTVSLLIHGQDGEVTADRLHWSKQWTLFISLLCYIEERRNSDC